MQSHFLKTVITTGTFVFVSLLLLNPDMYAKLLGGNIEVNANFLSNEYEQDMYVVNDISSLKEIWGSVQEFVSPIMSYTVQKGDSIDMIARKYAVSVDQIKNVNNIVDPDLRIGQKLYITNERGFIYPVKEESISLMVFANLYKFDLEELKRVNGQVNEMAPYRRGEAIFVPNKSLEDAYAISLLVRPEPVVQADKVVVVSVPKSNSTKKNSGAVSSKVKKTTTSVKTSSTAVQSWRYVFTEKSGMAAWQCTYYAAHKAKFAFPEISPGVRFRGITGNANKWLWSAKANGFKTSSTPSIGAIAVFKQWWSRYYSYGHVAIVEDVDRENNRMKVSDMNYAGLWIVTVRWISLNDSMTATKWWQTLMWFIPVQPLPSSLQKQYENAKS